MHDGWADGQNKERTSCNKPLFGKQEQGGGLGVAGPHKLDLTGIYHILRNLFPVSICPYQSIPSTGTLPFA